MKRVFALVLALGLALALPIVASSEEAGTTDVTYTVAASYQIEIPATGVDITGESATADIGVQAGTLIEPGKKLQISISNSLHYDAIANAGFCMQNEAATSVYMHYTISSATDTDIIEDEVFLEVEADEGYDGLTETLTFTPDIATAGQAGEYKDTITFYVVFVDI